ncbi:MAG TPA: hypothetical protein VGH43_20390 [Jatrophihabitans sp.]|jgi:hypothetical protein
MTEQRHDPDREDTSEDDTDRPALIPEADAGETDADSVSRDEPDEGHEEYKRP